MTSLPDLVPIGSVRTLVAAVQRLSMARTVGEVQRIVRTAARAVTGADGATFVLRDDDQCFYADEDAIEPLWKGSRFPLNACVSGWAMRHREPASIPDIYADARVPHDAYRPTFVKSLLVVPIRTLDPIGAIGNYWATLHEPTAIETDLLSALADSTAVALESVQVHELVSRDTLTGLLNRRGFEVAADRVVRRLHDERSPGVVLFADLDGLKSVNDEHGHAAGDALIAQAAAVLRRVFRGTDVIARLGGDEFAIVVEATEVEALSCIERLHAACRDISNAGGRLSMSVGAAAFEPGDSPNIEDLLATADAAMYEDKTRRRVRR